MLKGLMKNHIFHYFMLFKDLRYDYIRNAHGYIYIYSMYSIQRHAYLQVKLDNIYWSPTCFRDRHRYGARGVVQTAHLTYCWSKQQWVPYTLLFHNDIQFIIFIICYIMGYVINQNLYIYILLYYIMLYYIIYYYIILCYITLCYIILY